MAWPPQEPQPDSSASLAEDDAPQGLPVLELKPSFPFFDSDEPLVDGAPRADVSEPGDPFSLDEEPAFVPTDVTPMSAAHEEVPAAAAAPVLPPPVPRVKQPVGPRQMVMWGGALVAASALIFTILSMRPSASPEPVAGTPTPAPARKPAADRAATTAARTPGGPASTPMTPKWSQATASRWTGGDRKSVAFELQANNKIHIWTRDVTPVLVVRCHAGQVEPFVYTQSAARMEPQDSDHTVRVAFDDRAEVTERWPDSDEHDALFARDSAAFTHQLATAQTLRFGFEPHNAGPAVARFDVSGLSELLAAAAKPCGWKR